jgi:hypothetical protein
MPRVRHVTRRHNFRALFHQSKTNENNFIINHGVLPSGGAMLKNSVHLFRHAQMKFYRSH